MEEVVYNATGGIVECPEPKDARECAIIAARAANEKKASDIMIQEVSELTSMADYFVIVTVTSSAHWQGLYKQIKEYIKDNDLEIHLTNRKSPDGDDWNLIDLGAIVVHLMSESARSFYDLEKLWHAGKTIDFHA